MEIKDFYSFNHLKDVLPTQEIQAKIDISKIQAPEDKQKAKTRKPISCSMTSVVYQSQFIDTFTVISDDGKIFVMSKCQGNSEWEELPQIPQD